MSTMSITFGYAAAAGEAPIEDALTSLLKAGPSSAKHKRKAAKRLLLQAHLRLRAMVAGSGRPDLRQALDAADLLIAADLLAALVTDPTVRQGEIFRALIDLYLPGGSAGKTQPRGPMLSWSGSPQEMEPVLALANGRVETDAVALAAWITTVESRHLRGQYGANQADGVAFVADTLLAAYRDDDLPDSDTVSTPSLIASGYATVLGYQARTRADARAARAGAGA